MHNDTFKSILKQLPATVHRSLYFRVKGYTDEFPPEIEAFVTCEYMEEITRRYERVERGLPWYMVLIFRTEWLKPAEAGWWKEYMSEAQYQHGSKYLKRLIYVIMSV